MNPYPKKVEAPEQSCPWCDGTGMFCYATPFKAADVYRPCGQCGGTGQKRSA